MFSRELLPAFELSDKEIITRIAKDRDRRAMFYERYKILQDELYDSVESKMSQMFSPESFNDMKPYIDVSQNLMRRVIKELSIVYKDEHDRAVTPKGAQKTFEEVVLGIGYNERLARANFLLNGLNDLIFQIVSFGNKIDFHTLRPDMVTIFENDDKPDEVDAIAIEDVRYDETGKEIRQYIFWSPTRHFMIDEQGNKSSLVGNEAMVNPYRDANIAEGQFYPFVFAHNTKREDSFFDESSGNDLIEGTKLLAVKNTFLFMMFPMQFKQIAIKAEFDKETSVKNNQLKSPLHIFQTNADIQTLDWQTSITQLSEAIQAKVFSIASNYGISSENFKLTAQETSGFARMIAKEGLMEARQNQIKTWRKIEEDLFKAIRAVNNLNEVFPLMPDNAKFSIDYKEPNFAQDPIVELDVMQRKIDMGLINVLDVIKANNPDIKTDEQAEEVLQKNVDVRNRIKSKFNLGALSLNPTQQQQKSADGAIPKGKQPADLQEDPKQQPTKRK